MDHLLVLSKTKSLGVLKSFPTFFPFNSFRYSDDTFSLFDLDSFCIRRKDIKINKNNNILKPKKFVNAAFLTNDGKFHRIKFLLRWEDVLTISDYLFNIGYFRKKCIKVC